MGLCDQEGFCVTNISMQVTPTDKQPRVSTLTIRRRQSDLEYNWHKTAYTPQLFLAMWKVIFLRKSGRKDEGYQEAQSVDENDQQRRVPFACAWAGNLRRLVRLVGVSPLI